MIETTTYIDKDDVLEREKNLLSDITEYSTLISREAEELSQELDRLEAFDVIKKTARMLAHDYVVDLIEEIVEVEALKACMSSVEYDFGPYVKHLLKALKINIDKIVVPVDYGYGSILYDVGLNSLGEPEDWIKISIAAAAIMRKGRPYDDQASKDMFWRNYIYRAGRQSKIIVRKQKSRKKGRGRKKVKKIDETTKYATKYAETIKTRLALTPEDKAPFWYFLEYGNASNVGGTTGEPYPQVPPYPFKKNIESVLENAYKTQYNLLYNQIREEFDRLYDPTIYVRKKEEELERKIEETPFVEDYEYKGKQPTLEKLEAFENGILVQYEIFRTSTGKTSVRARAKETGRMVKGLLTEVLKKS